MCDLLSRRKVTLRKKVCSTLRPHYGNINFHSTQHTMSRSETQSNLVQLTMNEFGIPKKLLVTHSSEVLQHETLVIPGVPKKMLVDGFPVLIFNGQSTCFEIILRLICVAYGVMFLSVNISVYSTVIALLYLCTIFIGQAWLVGPPPVQQTLIMTLVTFYCR